jgi:hypothetical protein
MQDIKRKSENNIAGSPPTQGRQMIREVLAILKLISPSFRVDHTPFITHGWGRIKIFRQ